MLPEDISPEKHFNVSKTGYRALLLFKMLLNEPQSRQDIARNFSHDPVIGKDVSRDTVTNTVNLLKAAGCEITITRKNGVQLYNLKSHPFLPVIKKESVAILRGLRDSITSYCDWELIERINTLYIQIADFVENKNALDILLSHHPLYNVDKEVLKSMILYAREKQIICIDYKSPYYGYEDLYFVPDFISFENKRVYVWGYNLKYKDVSYLRMDRIRGVEPVFLANEQEIRQEYEKSILTVTYLLKGYSYLSFVPSKHERVILKDENSCLIEAKVYNKFNFIQRLLSFGCDCKIIGPQNFIREFVRILKEVKAVPYGR